MDRFALLFAGLIFAVPASGKVPADEQVLNIGHRGASGLAPEHTFAAYDLALKQGADYIEQDLQQTADGVLVVLHDPTLDRTARGPVENCTGPVNTKTLEQIKTCDVGSWFNEEYPKYAKKKYVGLKVPTLEEVFRRYGRGANYYIETKNPETAPTMNAELLRLMDEYRLREPAVEDWRVLIQSFSPESLQEMHLRDARLPLIQLYFGTSSASVRSTLDATQTYAVGIGPAKEDVDGDLVAAARERCLDIHPYTVNDSEEMKSHVKLGVDGMFTNFPKRLEKMLGKDAVGGNKAAGRASEDCRNGT